MVSLFIAGDVISPLTWLLFHGYHYIIANSTEDPYELFQERGKPLEFAKLSQYFEKLEKTSSRLSLIAILSELFSLIESPDEIEKVCYLVQGRVAPFFEALEIGMAEKTVARSIAIAYNTSPEQVLALYAALGDMGLVAEQLSKEI